MDLDFTDELREFQMEVRAFMAAKLPADLSEKVQRSLALVKDDYRRWQDILAEKGWLAYSWPVEHGGPGWSPAQCYIFQEEMGRANAPRRSSQRPPAKASRSCRCPMPSSRIAAS